VPVQRAAFERLVAEALSDIPDRFRAAMHNIAIIVEDEPSPALLEDMDIEPPDTLFGLYQGTPLSERDAAFGNTLPDQILLFQGPHERKAEDHEDLIVSIAETLIHEIGHYFGMTEEQIQEVEDHYWHSFAVPEDVTGDTAAAGPGPEKNPDGGEDDTERDKDRRR
jgi:predicted Zn-dependent protease with MMP-like domain